LIGGFDYENNAVGADDVMGPLMKGSPTGGGRPLPAIVTCMAHGQGGAEITEGYAPTLNCNHEQPIALVGNTIGREPHNGGNGTGFDESGAMYTLTKTDVHAVAYSFDSMSSNSMKSTNPDSGCNEVDVAKCLDTSRGLDPSCNQGGMAVAFSAGNSSGARSIGYSEEHTPPLRAGASGTNQVPTVVFAQNTRDEVREMEVPGALAAQPGMKQTSYLRQGMQVRRLTPLECERLQGFPDNYTNIPGASDSARYKALGNSMAVNVMQLIGQRIQMVENIA
jgi:DNA (cytosine-5)-methyltransferase 1